MKGLCVCPERVAQAEGRALFEQRDRHTGLEIQKTRSVATAGLLSNERCSTRYIIPGIPPPIPPGIAGIAGEEPSSGLSVIRASVVSISEAMLDAF